MEHKSEQMDVCEKDLEKYNQGTLEEQRGLNQYKRDATDSNQTDVNMNHHNKEEEQQQTQTAIEFNQTTATQQQQEGQTTIATAQQQNDAAIQQQQQQQRRRRPEDGGRRQSHEVDATDTTKSNPNAQPQPMKCSSNNDNQTTTGETETETNSSSTLSSSTTPSSLPSPTGVIIAGDESPDELRRNETLSTLQARFAHRLSREAIYRGLLLNETITVEGLEGLRKGELRPEDCLVCGYPKSGTTWLEEIVYLVLHKGDFTAAKSYPCYIRVPLWEDLRMRDVIRNTPSPRTLKTHMPFELLPASTQNSNRIVCILRNPKDVVVSYYYFYQSLTELNNYSGTWAEFLQMFMEGYVVNMSWFEHVASWWEQRKRANVLMLTYERMKKTPEKVIREIAEFLHGSAEVLEGDTLSQIVRHTSFKSMKANPNTNFANIDGIRLPFMRKGEVGDWRNHFTVAQNDAFDTLIRQKVSDPELLAHIQDC